MSDFSEQVRVFSERVTTKNRAVFVRVVELATESIVHGSAITGAPGQPVSFGNLRASWQTVFDSPESAIIGTNVAYAPVIEDDVRDAYVPTGKTFPREPGAGPPPKSEIGGHHSVALTRAGFRRLVAAAEAEVAR